MESDFYDNCWDTNWDDMKKYGPFSRHLRRILISELNKISFNSLLDVGCGQGALLSELNTKYPEVDFHGIDFSSSAINIAKKNNINSSFYKLDISIESLNRKFDVVVCSEVLEHIKKDEAAIQNLHSMTEKYLLISSPQGRMRKFEKTVVGHIRNYSKGELVSKLKSSGLEPVKVIEWGFPFYSPLYREFLDLSSAWGTGGNFGPVRKLISNLIYYLFYLNSSIFGDEIVVLARPD